VNHDTVLNPEGLGADIRPISECDLRVGIVPYLNTKPIVFGLKSLAPKLRIVEAPPSQLASRLRAGELDVALVPVLEYFSQPDYGILDSSAICADGKVRSVALFSQVPIEQVRSVCLDPESLTSNALVRVLCRHRFFVKPQWTARPLGSDPREILEKGESDAVLVIGNTALLMSGRYEYEYDLGQEWWNLAHLPFVFAVWAVRPGAETGDLGEVLRRCRRLGVSHLEGIAAEAARTIGLDRGLCLAYLKQMIRYKLTRRAWRGMARFFDACARMGFCPPVPPPALAAHVGRLKRAGGLRSG